MALLMMAGTASAQEVSKDEMKFWKNKAKMYKKRPLSLKAEFENYQNQIKDLKRRNKELLQRTGPGSETNELLDSLRWAVIQLEGELQAERQKNKKLELTYQASQQFSDENIKPGLVYRVQIVASVFKEISQPGQDQEDIMVERADGFNKLLVGSFRTYEECAAFRDELRKQGLKDAWIVPYIDGVRVTIQEAELYMENHGG
ncbi:MAG: SPOR domain-containing protein [Bacteroidetes bacterium]|nr:MAG: SPOR domain-containing protein [Bacteroidota bacterium]